ncbi:hypothetical protein AURDEDRAFT_167294 [Auricularia subglabra TFB-10046 SS5]|nr:hypothetical protein AURDEDRAFT_167294 [Auricularia subglabra TFB-10046 SS5]
MLSFKNLLLVVAIASGHVAYGAPAILQEVRRTETVVEVHAVLPGGSSKNNSTHQKRAGPGIYVTTEVNWAGPHLYIANVVKGQCYTFATSWQNVISSFGPDQGLKCYGYQQANCQPPSPNYGPFYYPGIFTHSAWGQDSLNYDNKVNSFKCWDGTPPPHYVYEASRHFECGDRFNYVYGGSYFDHHNRNRYCYIHKCLPKAHVDEGPSVLDDFLRRFGHHDHHLPYEVGSCRID